MRVPPNQNGRPQTDRRIVIGECRHRRHNHQNRQIDNPSTSHAALLVGTKDTSPAPSTRRGTMFMNTISDQVSLDVEHYQFS
jgi:hypothetical protein